MKNTQVTRYCLKCGKEMKVALWRLRCGHGKFCSQSCAISYIHKGLPKPKSKVNIVKATEALRGKPAWNRLPQIDITCKQCGNVFSVANPRKNTAKFCSRKCHYEFNKTINGKNHPYFHQVVKNCLWCGKEFSVAQGRKNKAQFCSYECHGSWTVRKANKISKPEVMIGDALRSLELPFEAQYRIGKYACDFVLLQHKLVIEADGDYWHSLPESIRRDKEKDIYLRKNGWTVLRFREKDIHKNLTKCLLRINKHVPLIQSG